MPKRARTHADSLRVQERRDLVFDLRMQGGTYREIAQYVRENHPNLCNPEKYDHSHVFQDIDVELTKYATRIEGKAAQLREEENQRLEIAYRKMMSKVVSSGDMGALDRMLSIHDRRVKLYGLAGPQKLAMTDPSGENEAKGPQVLVFLPDNSRGDRDPDIVGCIPPEPTPVVDLPDNRRQDTEEVDDDEFGGDDEWDEEDNDDDDN